MNRNFLLSLITAASAMGLIYLAPSFAQNQEDADAPPPPSQQSDDQTDQPSADEVLEDLLRRRSDNPVIDPAQPQPAEPQPEGNRAARAVEGIAPGAGEAQLRREGEFVITRRGRMVRAPGDISGWVFVFEGDSSRLHEPPMYLMPCQLLEDMEEIVQQQGEDAVFTISGQIFLYRGANYLLPTLMKLEPDRGNLE